MVATDVLKESGVLDYIEGKINDVASNGLVHTYITFPEDLPEITEDSLEVIRHWLGTFDYKSSIVFLKDNGWALLVNWIGKEVKTN